jgi:hypothetical protein
MTAIYARVVLADISFAERTSGHGPTNTRTDHILPKGLAADWVSNLDGNNGVAEKGPGRGPFHTAERAGNTDTKNTPVIPSVVRPVPS